MGKFFVVILGLVLGILTATILYGRASHMVYLERIGLIENAESVSPSSNFRQGGLVVRGAVLRWSFEGFDLPLGPRWSYGLVGGNWRVQGTSRMGFLTVYAETISGLMDARFLNAGIIGQLAVEAGTATFSFPSGEFLEGHFAGAARALVVDGRIFNGLVDLRYENGRWTVLRQ